MDFFNQFNYWGRLDPEKGVYEEIEEKGQALFAHMEDFVWLYHHLGDYRSKKTLYAILNNWYRYDFTTTAQAKEYLFDDYFDLDPCLLQHGGGGCGPGGVYRGHGALLPEKLWPGLL